MGVSIHPNAHGHLYYIISVPLRSTAGCRRRTWTKMDQHSELLISLNTSALLAYFTKRKLLFANTFYNINDKIADLLRQKV